MTTNFKVSQSGGYSVDLDDILIRREYFSDNSLWGWGSTYSSPITTSGGGINWRQISDNSAIKSDGTLWTFTPGTSPVSVPGGGTTWSKLSSNSTLSAGIKSDGTLWTWGSNGSGQLGDNSTTSKTSPVTTAGGGSNWIQVASGDNHTAAVKTDGTLWTWGANSYGQLGDNSTTSKSSPVTTVGGGTNWKQVSCGTTHTAAIKTDGTLWTWGGGSNTGGILGANSIGDSVTPRSSPNSTMAGGTNWKQVSSKRYNSAAVKTDGTLWTWGDNRYGQLGDGSLGGAGGNNNAKSSPVTTIGGGTNWRQISCGYTHMAAVKTDGSLWSWGSNTSGELGDNSSVNSRLSPVTTVSGGTTWKTVAGGKNATIALIDLTI